jgi:hypothetical protein
MRQNSGIRGMWDKIFLTQRKNILLLIIKASKEIQAIH